MPRLIHNAWCEDHADDSGLEVCCTGIVAFGPPDPDDPADTVGYCYLMQAENEDEPSAVIYYRTDPHVHDSTISVGVLRQLVTALDADAAATHAALKTLLTALDTEPTNLKDI